MCLPQCSSGVYASLGCCFGVLAPLFPCRGLRQAAQACLPQCCSGVYASVAAVLPGWGLRLAAQACLPQGSSGVYASVAAVWAGLPICCVGPTPSLYSARSRVNFMAFVEGLSSAWLIVVRSYRRVHAWRTPEQVLWCYGSVSLLCFPPHFSASAAALASLGQLPPVTPNLPLLPAANSPGSLPGVGPSGVVNSATTSTVCYCGFCSHFCLVCRPDPGSGSSWRTAFHAFRRSSCKRSGIGSSLNCLNCSQQPPLGRLHPPPVSRLLASPFFPGVKWFVTGNARLLL